MEEKGEGRRRNSLSKKRRKKLLRNMELQYFLHLYGKGTVDLDLLRAFVYFVLLLTIFHSCEEENKLFFNFESFRFLVNSERFFDAFRYVSSFIGVKETVSEDVGNYMKLLLRVAFKNSKEFTTSKSVREFKKCMHVLQSKNICNCGILNLSELKESELCQLTEGALFESLKEYLSKKFEGSYEELKNSLSTSETERELFEIFNVPLKKRPLEGEVETSEKKRRRIEDNEDYGEDEDSGTSEEESDYSEESSEEEEPRSTGQFIIKLKSPKKNVDPQKEFGKDLMKRTENEFEKNPVVKKDNSINIFPKILNLKVPPPQRMDVEEEVMVNNSADFIVGINSEYFESRGASVAPLSELMKEDEDDDDLWTPQQKPQVVTVSRRNSYRRGVGNVKKKQQQQKRKKKKRRRRILIDEQEEIGLTMSMTKREKRKTESLWKRIVEEEKRRKRSEPVLLERAEEEVLTKKDDDDDDLEMENPVKMIERQKKKSTQSPPQTEPPQPLQPIPSPQSHPKEPPQPLHPILSPQSQSQQKGFSQPKLPPQGGPVRIPVLNPRGYFQELKTSGTYGYVSLTQQAFRNGTQDENVRKHMNNPKMRLLRVGRPSSSLSSIQNVTFRQNQNATPTKLQVALRKGPPVIVPPHFSLFVRFMFILSDRYALVFAGRKKVAILDLVTQNFHDSVGNLDCVGGNVKTVLRINVHNNPLKYLIVQTDRSECVLVHVNYSRIQGGGKGISITANKIHVPDSLQNVFFHSLENFHKETIVGLTFDNLIVFLRVDYSHLHGGHMFSQPIYLNDQIQREKLIDGAGIILDEMVLSVRVHAQGLTKSATIDKIWYNRIAILTNKRFLIVELVYDREPPVVTTTTTTTTTTTSGLGSAEGMNIHFCRKLSEFEFGSIFDGDYGVNSGEIGVFTDEMVVFRIDKFVGLFQFHYGIVDPVTKTHLEILRTEKFLYSCDYKKKIVYVMYKNRNKLNDKGAYLVSIMSFGDWNKNKNAAQTRIQLNVKVKSVIFDKTVVPRSFSVNDGCGYVVDNLGRWWSTDLK